jgi:hypothetical protein
MNPPPFPAVPPAEKPSEKITSRMIVAELHRYTDAHPVSLTEKLAFLNSYVTADFVSVTGAGQVFEYEVKVSRSDYVRERKKLRHEIYSEGGKFNQPGRSQYYTKPHRFWIVAPPGIVKPKDEDPDDLLDYAGLIEFDVTAPKGGRLTIRRKAPKLRKESFSWKEIASLIAAAMKRRRNLSPALFNS